MTLSKGFIFALGVLAACNKGGSVGASCKTILDCSSSLFCTSGKCAKDQCITSGDCLSAQQCSAGLCVAGNSTGGLGSGSTGGAIVLGGLTSNADGTLTLTGTHLDSAISATVATQGSSSAATALALGAKTATTLIVGAGAAALNLVQGQVYDFVVSNAQASAPLSVTFTPAPTPGEIAIAPFVGTAVVTIPASPPPAPYLAGGGAYNNNQATGITTHDKTSASAVFSIPNGASSSGQWTIKASIGVSPSCPAPPCTGTLATMNVTGAAFYVTCSGAGKSWSQANTALDVTPAPAGATFDQGTIAASGWVNPADIYFQAVTATIPAPFADGDTQCFLGFIANPAVAGVGIGFYNVSLVYDRN